MQFQEVRHGIFRSKMCAAGKEMRFQGATKEILRYKICAAGENSAVSERYKEDFRVLKRGFYVRKYAPQANILRFHEATNDI